MSRENTFPETRGERKCSSSRTSLPRSLSRILPAAEDIFKATGALTPASFLLKPLPQLLRTYPLFPQLPQTQRIMPLRQTDILFVAQQRTVKILVSNVLARGSAAVCRAVFVSRPRLLEAAREIRKDLSRSSFLKFHESASRSSKNVNLPAILLDASLVVPILTHPLETQEKQILQLRRITKGTTKNALAICSSHFNVAIGEHLLYRANK